MLVYILILIEIEKKFWSSALCMFQFCHREQKLGFQFCKFYAAVGVGSNFFVYSLHFPTILKASFQIHLKP